MSGLSYVGHATGYATGSATSIASSARAVSSGAHLLVCVRWDGTGTEITVTDTEDNTFTPLTQAVADGVVGCQWFYCLTATGGAAHVVTADFAAARTYRSIYVVEVGGDAAAVQEVTPSTGSTTYLSTAPGAYTYPAGSILLVGSATYSADPSPEILASGETFTALTITSDYHVIAYAASASGGSANAITVQGTPSDRVLATLVVEAVAEPPPQQRARVFVAT